MNQELKEKILSLCRKVEEVMSNNDWPTEEGRMYDFGTVCTCPLNELVRQIKAGLEEN